MKIHVEIRPPKIFGARKSHVQKLFDRGILEPWEGGEWKKQLVVIQEKPESMSRNIRHLNCGSDGPMRCGFNLRAPAQGVAPSGSNGRSGRRSCPDNLPKDLLADSTSKRPAADQVDPPASHRSQQALKVHQSEQIRRTPKFDKHVKVAMRSLFAPCERSENAYLANVE